MFNTGLVWLFLYFLLMKLVDTHKKLNQIIVEAKSEGKTVGFVPTMGALHKGHLSLVRQAREQADLVVVSIFVNPTQFNDKSDLEKYPRTLQTDLNLLEKENCDLVFAPMEEEMYPEKEIKYLDIDLGGLDTVMEGKHRPGHFKGVALVVYRLFDMVQPDVSFFGEKDFQQVAVIRSMAKQMNCQTKVVACPIIREEDGLAMSSRNMRLKPEYRKASPLISKCLFDAKELSGQKSVKEVEEYVKEQIAGNEILELEYFEIVNKDTLLPTNSWNTPGGCVACIAVWAGDVRLIDNIQF